MAKLCLTSTCVASRYTLDGYDVDGSEIRRFQTTWDVQNPVFIGDKLPTSIGEWIPDFWLPSTVWKREMRKKTWQSLKSASLEGNESHKKKWRIIIMIFSNEVGSTTYSEWYRSFGASSWMTWGAEWCVGFVEDLETAPKLTGRCCQHLCGLVNTFCYLYSDLWNGNMKSVQNPPYLYIPWNHAYFKGTFIPSKIGMGPNPNGPLRKLRSSY